MLPTMLRDRTTMPRTTPRFLTMRWPGSSNAVVTCAGLTCGMRWLRSWPGLFAERPRRLRGFPPVSAAISRLDDLADHRGRQRPGPVLVDGLRFGRHLRM